MARDQASKSSGTASPAAGETPEGEERERRLKMARLHRRRARGPAEEEENNEGKDAVEKQAGESAGAESEAGAEEEGAREEEGGAREEEGGAREEEDAPPTKEPADVVEFEAGPEKHKLWIAPGADGPQVMVASDPKQAVKKLMELRDLVASEKDEKQRAGLLAMVEHGLELLGKVGEEALAAVRKDLSVEKAAGGARKALQERFKHLANSYQLAQVFTKLFQYQYNREQQAHGGPPPSSGQVAKRFGADMESAFGVSEENPGHVLAESQGRQQLPVTLAAGVDSQSGMISLGQSAGRSENEAAFRGGTAPAHVRDNVDAVKQFGAGGSLTSKKREALNCAEFDAIMQPIKARAQRGDVNLNKDLKREELKELYEGIHVSAVTLPSQPQEAAASSSPPPMPSSSSSSSPPPMPMPSSSSSSSAPKPSSSSSSAPSLLPARPKPAAAAAGGMPEKAEKKEKKGKDADEDDEELEAEDAAEDLVEDPAEDVSKDPRLYSHIAMCSNCETAYAPLMYGAEDRRKEEQAKKAALREKKEAEKRQHSKMQKEASSSTKRDNANEQEGYVAAIERALGDGNHKKELQQFKQKVKQFSLAVLRGAAEKIEAGKLDAAITQLNLK
jgi:hypothetical protein